MCIYVCTWVCLSASLHPFDPGRGGGVVECEQHAEQGGVVVEAGAEVPLMQHARLGA